MNSSRSDFGHRLVLPLVFLHLAYAVLFATVFRAISTEASLIAWFLISGSALAYGKVAGLLSGASLAVMQMLGLGFIRFQSSLSAGIGSALNQAALPEAASLADILVKLTAFAGFVLASAKPVLILMPALGFLTGLCAEKFGLRNPKTEQRLQALTRENVSRQTQSASLEAALHHLTHERAYLGDWAKLFDRHALNEQLVGILLASVTAPGWMPNGQSSGVSQAIQWAPDSTRQLFETLRQGRPDVLAVLSPDGQIRYGNETLFAIYGFQSAADFVNKSIFELIMPDDAARAAEAIKRSIISGLPSHERYSIKPPRHLLTRRSGSGTHPAADPDLNRAGAECEAAATAGFAYADQIQPIAMDRHAAGYHRLLISPQIVLELAGSPRSLVACVSSSTLDSSAHAAESDQTPAWLKQPVAPSDPDHAMGLMRRNPPTAASANDPILSSLSSRCLCCLYPDGRIYYVSPALAVLLDKSADAIIGKRFDRLISWKHADRFETLHQGLVKGQHTSLELEMMPHDGRRRIFQVKAFPAVDIHERYLGCTLLIDDVSSVRLVEEALQHRLSMEKIISSISTRFISIKAADLDREITQVLQILSDFEQAAECRVEISKSKRVRQPIAYSITRPDLTEKPVAVSDQRRSRHQDMDRFETISIPIVIESETAGHFSFLQECYHDSWFETDLELIRLIGEIIINGIIRRENELEIKMNETRLATTIQSIREGVIATDPDGRIILMNQTAESLTGWSRESALCQPLENVFHPCAPVSATLEDQKVSELHPLSKTDDSLQLVSKDGHQYFIQSSRSLIRDHHAIYGEVTVFRDVTQEKHENDEIRYISYHDKLTGLYNRAFFEEELIRLNTQRQYPITLIIGDCNGLKIANDIFGHLEGDRLLQTIAHILKKATRHEDIVARWGGDEFTIILPKTDEAAGARIRERILQLCAEAPFDPIQPSLAMGSATNTEDGLACNDLVGVLKLAEDRMYRHKLMEGKSARNTLLISIERMIYEKSYETEEHASRLQEISAKLGRAVGLSAFEQEELSLLSVLHDIGKVGIPDQILTKPERLSDEEWEIMRKHAEKGYNLAKSTPELASIADSILHHHERWDGCGYPSGLHGEEIPKLSRILSIIDAYDVITHARAYKPAQSKADALLEIERCAGSQFDPELTQVFVEIMKQE